MPESHSVESSLQSEPPSVEDTTSSQFDSEPHTTSVQSHSASRSSVVIDLECVDLKPANCPKLHWYTFKGDLAGILACINAGDDLERTITMMNAKLQPVHGVTALYIAAQKGFLETCRLLVENGADVDVKCSVVGSGERCTPAKIAQARGHYKTWWYLAKRQEKKPGLVRLFARRTS